MTETLDNPVAFLSDVHRAYLNEHAVSDEVIAAQGIRSEGDDIVFTWREGDQVTEQRRPWPGGSGVYFWTQGADLHLNILRDPGPDAPVLLTEGTKQSLAVASWAPPEYAVYGMPGCYGWTMSRKLDLSRFAGRQVLIMLDADAADNLDVWEAGVRLASELEMEDPPASALFIHSPAWGKDGIDDYLGRIAAGRRAGRLARLLAGAQPKPADRKPTRRKVPDQVPDTGGLPLVVVNKNRREVIHEILGHMRQRWDGSALFCYGGVLTRLRGTTTEPLDRDSFTRWMAEAVDTYRYRPPGQATPGSYEAAWPEPQTIGALLASGEEFAPLAGVSRTPFIRPDGTVCFKNGYDWDPETGTGTQTMLVTGNSGMDRLDIPARPTRDQAAMAAHKLLGDWLGNDPATGKRGMPWRDEASRANALALILTPFIRGAVPLAPLAVISGLQMGVGKNLLADCISLMTTGENVQPLPWIPDDDDEIRKQILSSFRAGSSLVCFDEAHVIGGPALTRAITATTYADRILGVSKMASYPNRVTWMSLGNQVSVLADMARRAYFVELYPDGPDPENRPGSEFRHEDPRGWTLENRPELVTAALTMLRAWYAAGCPAFPRGSLMGSFEAWDKIMSGVLGWAGVPGFLGNLGVRRAERDTTGGFWAEHLAWLRGQFGTGEFTALDVKTKAMSSGGAWDAPPRLDEPGDRGFTRNLGLAYAQNQDRWFGPRRIVKTRMGHGTKGLWQVQERDEDFLDDPLHPLHPLHPEDDTLPDLGGMKGMKQSFIPAPSAQPSLPGHAESPGMGAAESDTLPALGFSPGDEGPPLASWPAQGSETLSDLEGQDPRDEGDEGDELSLPSRDARAGAHAHTRTHTREGGGSTSASSPSSAGDLVIAVDLETDDASRLFLAPRGAAPGNGGFVRLAGAIGPGGDPVIAPVGDVLEMISLADRVDTHNGMGFDGLALAWHHGADWHRLAAKIRDTELIARQVNPPRSRESGISLDKYDLDHVAAEMGLPGKTDELPRLARKHGGYGSIPLDDPEYRSYLEGDLRATAAVSAALMPYYDMDPYIRREHQLAAIAGRMSLNGLAVDHSLLARRTAEVNQAKADAAQALHDGWGLPLSRTVMRGRGEGKHEETEVFASPIATSEGGAWLAGQFERYQVPSPPLTDTGKLATGADMLRPIAEDPGCPGGLRQMLGLMAVVTTARTVYQTAADWLCPDGRVHPKISMRQASGRWSFLKPGLTVYGKHAGRHVERDIFLPDEGEMLISFDLSQVDMRAMAGHCQDPAYIAMFGFHPDGTPRDPHTEIGQQVGLGRQDAKAVGHGWNYGLSVQRMIREGMDPEKVYGFDNGMREQFGGLISWRETIRETGKAGQILDNGFGRRMRCDPVRAYTVAPALMGQGGARDIMCECLLRLPSWTWPMLRAMVHDEVILSVPPEALREVVRAVTAAMTWTWAGVPILCDINGPGLSWGEISGKCGDCGQGAHGQGFCGVYAEMKGLAAVYEAGSS